MNIPAECHDDNRIAQCPFDALLWAEHASDSEMMDLASCGYRNDYPADEVAIFMADFNDEIAFMFKYIEKHNDEVGDNIGFECSVEREPFLEWVKINRPDVFTTILVNEGSEDWD